MIFIAGDFSVKTGKCDVKDPSIGRYSRGRRNAIGKESVGFC